MKTSKFYVIEKSLLSRHNLWWLKDFRFTFSLLVTKSWRSCCTTAFDAKSSFFEMFFYHSQKQCFDLSENDQNKMLYFNIYILIWTSTRKYLDYQVNSIELMYSILIFHVRETTINAKKIKNIQFQYKINRLENNKIEFWTRVIKYAMYLM